MHPVADPTSNERLHAMDALRAIAMLLGIALHAMMAYMERVWKIWPADDESSSPAFNVAFWIIHLFRMEVFFLMAGFFACLLLARYGMAGFLKNRAGRIAAPLALAMVTILPVLNLVNVWGARETLAQPRPDYWHMVERSFTHRDIDEYLFPAHLWFLEHLLVFCAIAALLHLLCARVRAAATIANAVANAWAWTIRKRASAIALAAIIFPILLLQSGPGVETQSDALPPWNVLLYYAPFFLAGWLLCHRRRALADLARLWHVQLVLGLALGIWYYILKRQFAQGHDILVLVRAAAALATALLTIGFTGMFLRIFHQPSRVMRYVSDASYWMYLIHLPLVIALNITLLDLPAPAIVKFLLVCVLAGTIMLASYALFVRYTWIGFFLNGPRVRQERERRRADRPSAQIV